MNQIRLSNELALASLVRGTTALKFSKDGKWLAAGDGEGQLFLWKFGPDGQVEHSWQSAIHQSLPDGTNGSIDQIVFEEGGRYLATQSKVSKTGALWDLSALPDDSSSMAPLLSDLLSENVAAIGFVSPAKNSAPRLIVGRVRGDVESWTLAPNEILRALCRTVGRTLTQSETLDYLGGTNVVPSCQNSGMEGDHARLLMSTKTASQAPR